MFRTRIRKLPHLQTSCKVTTKSNTPVVQIIRNSSNVGSPTGSSGFVRILLGTGTLTALAGGTIAYAKYDPKFRKAVEEKIPYSDLAFNYVFEKVFGGKSTFVPKKPDQKAENSSEVSLMQKQIERKSKEQSSALSPTVEPASQVPVKTKAPQDSGSLKTSDITNDKEQIENKLPPIDPVIKTKNMELDSTLKKNIEELEDVVDEAVSARRKAAHATVFHAEKLMKALDESEGSGSVEIDMTDVYTANEVKKKTLSESIVLINKASEKIMKLKTLIEDARANDTTAANKNLFPAEDNIQAAYDKLAKVEKQYLEAELHKATAEKYQKKLEDLRNKHQDDLKGVLPNSGMTLTAEEANLAFIFVCKKIDEVHKALAIQQASEKEIVEEAMQKQKAEDDMILDRTVSVELARQSREMAISQERKVQEIKDHYDFDLRQGLRRQLAAHVEHVQECLQTQAKNLEAEYKEIIDQKVLEERALNETALASSFGKLKSIEEFLSARKDLDYASRKAKELWLACQALKTTLKSGKLEDVNSDMNLKPLNDEVSAIKKAAGEANPFVKVLIDSIPDEAIDRGVYTEEALRERFKKVERICRRVAIVDDTGGTLFKYFISYVQSFFILTPSVAAEEIEKDQVLDISSLGTFDIISRVEICLQQDNLEQALRYINLLKGEPRRVAHDWIKELRLLLETRQAADTIIAHAAATNVQAYH